jgi:hypothetical protein
MSNFNKDQEMALEVIASGYEYDQNVKDAFMFVNANPAIGMPATFYIGSDCYAYEVVSIEYFKSGKKAGQPKSIVAKRDNGIETFVYSKRGFQQYYQYGENYGSFRVGKAVEYRDPSF